MAAELGTEKMSELEATSLCRIKVKTWPEKAVTTQAVV
jgi:hypothetical protein